MAMGSGVVGLYCMLRVARVRITNKGGVTPPETGRRFARMFVQCTQHGANLEPKCAKTYRLVRLVRLVTENLLKRGPKEEFDHELT